MPNKTSIRIRMLTQCLVLVFYAIIWIFGGYMFYLMWDLNNKTHQQFIEFKQEIQQSRQDFIDSIQRLHIKEE